MRAWRGVTRSGAGCCQPIRCRPQGGPGREQRPSPSVAAGPGGCGSEGKGPGEAEVLRRGFREGWSGSGGKGEALSWQGCTDGWEEAGRVEAERRGISARSGGRPQARIWWHYKGD